ncbi:Cys-tRNA(Pro) deacylase [Planctomonas sp. JC2975]|uniref:Cys-tRNA(Pro) deacylase n=1 Tax=Planctomonas sp. JC2975 TaxID=2729626 RepID=UPI0014730B6C|nr:Cys-tRNA(Pro) deacylase [Planctomonas sp. JC2975]NNC10932.1 Cys-tRNA(Pro) deacylase [Planctomonas sp. JC2975]
MATRSAGTPATVALSRAGIPFVPHAYEHDPDVTAFGLEAAHELAVDPARVFKTLLADADGRLVVGIVPVTGQLDLKALAAAVGAKRAALADAAVAQRKTGYVLGGISPIGQKTRLATVLDASASDFDTVFVSGGRRGFDIELAPADLLRATDGMLSPIGR